MLPDLMSEFGRCSRLYTQNGLGFAGMTSRSSIVFVEPDAGTAREFKLDTTSTEEAWIDGVTAVSIDASVGVVGCSCSFIFRTHGLYGGERATRVRSRFGGRNILYLLQKFF